MGTVSILKGFPLHIQCLGNPLSIDTVPIIGLNYYVLDYNLIINLENNLNLVYFFIYFLFYGL